MNYLSKLILAFLAISALGLNNDASAQISKTMIDLEKVDYSLNVPEFYSQSLLIAVSRDYFHSIKGVYAAVEHSTEEMKNSSLMYQIDTLTSCKSERGVWHPELLTYHPMMWTPKPVVARFGSYDFECVKMASVSDHRLVLISAHTYANEKETDAFRQLLTDKYGAPTYEKSQSKNSLNKQCRWQTNDEYIQLQTRDKGDRLEIKLFRWQKKDGDLIVTYRPFLLDVFFEQEGSIFYPV